MLAEQQFGQDLSYNRNIGRQIKKSGERFLWDQDSRTISCRGVINWEQRCFMTTQDRPGGGLDLTLLGHLYQLLKEHSPASVPDLLQGIAEHFDVSGAGLCSLPTAPPFCVQFFKDRITRPTVYP